MKELQGNVWVDVAEWRLSFNLRGNTQARSTTVALRMEPEVQFIFGSGKHPLPEIGLTWELVQNWPQGSLGQYIHGATVDLDDPLADKTVARNIIPPISDSNHKTWGIKMVVTNTADGGTLLSHRTPVSSTQIRCDNSSEIWETVDRAGCVNVAWTPNIDFPAVDYPGISQNIAAGKALHNNAGSVGNPLIKNTRAERDANRDATCGSSAYFTPRIGARPSTDPITGKEYQCDEYPLASSTLGGPGNNVKWVLQPENSSQGGRLGALYTTHRIMPGDWYYVF